MTILKSKCHVCVKYYYTETLIPLSNWYNQYHPVKCEKIGMPEEAIDGKTPPSITLPNANQPFRKPSKVLLKAAGYNHFLLANATAEFAVFDAAFGSTLGRPISHEFHIILTRLLTRYITIVCLLCIYIKICVKCIS